MNLCVIFIKKLNPTKMVQFVKYSRWSTYSPFMFYFIFILIILTLSFPLKSNHLLKETDTKRPIKKIVPAQKETETLILSTNDEILRSAFKKADLNRDQFLNIQELGKYINVKIREHIDLAIKTNPIVFTQIDLSPRDGLISWEEYHEHFLRERGLDEKYIKDHSEIKHDPLDRKSKETLMRDKALWGEAARTDPFFLTLDEFLAFRHPESSSANLLNLVDDLLRQFDEDGDDRLTIEEWSNEEMEGKRQVISKNIDERKMEFSKLIDKNGDKKADRSELLNYIDPRHPRHSIQEAANLFSLADVNKDLKLSLKEILNHSELFLQSKMINTSESFHDEF